MGSPMTLSHLTLGDPERSKSTGRSYFGALYLVKEQRPYVPIKH